MQTVTLKFDVSGQNLIAGDLTRYASNTVNYVKAVFDLDGNWNSFDSVRAVWSTDFECISTVLDSEGVCYVPQEVLKRTGNVMVNLVGSIAENDELTDRLTTYPVVALVINANAKVCGTETAEVTPSQFEQYVAMVVAEVEKVTGMTATAVALPEGSAPTAVYENGVLTLGIPKGDKGETGNGISSVEFNADYSLTFNFTESEPYTTPSIRGERGAQGYGIVSVEKIGTAGLVDTYQVNYEDSSVPPTTFTVTNGAKGDTGNGISSVTKTGTVGLVDTYRITFTNGGHYDFNVTNGAKGDTGATGNGIATIAKTSTSGLVDTYTITFTDGTSTTFEVTNGADGEITEDNLQGSLEDMLSGYSISNGNYDSNNEPYTFRKSGGGALVGVREDVELVGGTVAWNQLFEVDQHWDAAGGTFVDNDGVFEVTSDGNANCYYRYQKLDVTLPNHVYLIGADIELDSGNANEYPNTTLLISWSGGYAVKSNPPKGSWGSVSAILKPTVAASVIAFYVFGTTSTPSGEKAQIKNRQLIDLTAMFGSTVADYIYTLEQGTAGAGVAFFRKYFPKPYYPYDAGTIKSVEGVSAHKTVGFNQFEKSTVAQGHYIDNDGSDQTYGILSHTDYIKAVPNTIYYISDNQASANVKLCACYDSNKNFIEFAPAVDGNGKLRRTLPNTAYIIVNMLTSVIDTLCINLSWDGERNGEYEPYVEHSYPLDDSLTLRGIPKIANGKLYYDGDTYESDGKVTRKYAVVDLGTLTWIYESSIANVHFFAQGRQMNPVPKYQGGLICPIYVWNPTGQYSIIANMEMCVDNTPDVPILRIKNDSYTSASDFKTAMSGVYLVYELAEPTEETADSYNGTQIVDDFGTEEYVTTSIVPVGHSTKYPPDDLGKLDMLANIPSPPNNNGTYTLEVTVLNGNTTYIWV